MVKLTKGIYAAGILTANLYSGATFADHESINYDYVQASTGVNELTSGPASNDGESIAVRGSLTFNKNLFVTGGLQTAALDNGVDSLKFDASLGYRSRIANDPNNPIDMYATLGVEHFEIDNGGSSIDFQGVLAALGIRIKLLAHLEGIAELQYRSLDTDDFGMFDGFGYMVGIVYSMSRYLDLGVYYEFSDIENSGSANLENQSIMVKARYRFR